MRAYGLADPPRSGTSRLAERLLTEGRYLPIGTDTHDSAGLPHRLRGLAAAQTLVGEAELDRLTITNPRTLMSKDEG